jgi:ankyrin repeat protein
MLHGTDDVVAQLIEIGCSPNERDLLGNTPLHEAVEKGHLDIAEILLKQGEFSLTHLYIL